MTINYIKIERYIHSQIHLEKQNLVKKKAKKFTGKPVGKPFTNLGKRPVIRRTTHK